MSSASLRSLAASWRSSLASSRFIQGSSYALVKMRGCLLRRVPHFGWRCGYECLLTKGQNRAWRFGEDPGGGSANEVSGDVGCAARAHDDEIRGVLLREVGDLISRCAVGDEGAQGVGEWGVIWKALPELLFKASPVFVGLLLRGAFDVEENEVGLMLLGNAVCVSVDPGGVGIERGCADDSLRVPRGFGRGAGLGSDHHDGACDLTQDGFGVGAEEEALPSGAAVGSHHQQVDPVVFDDGEDPIADGSDHGEAFGAESLGAEGCASLLELLRQLFLNVFCVEPDR